MSDIRELRLALESKLKHRRRLIAENSRMARERDTAHAVMNSRMCNFILENCADQIINEILNRAMSASKTIAEQTAETGDYVIGIDIPSLHIRRQVSRMDIFSFRDDRMIEDRKIRHLRV